MLLKDLFLKYNVDCPEWLSYVMIEDKWEDSEYSFEEGVHKWSFKDQFSHVTITFDGETYITGAYIDGLFYMLQKITEGIIIDY